MTDYPDIEAASFGQITVGEAIWQEDICLLADGTVAKRDKAIARKHYGGSHNIGPRELEPLCEGGPEVLFVGTGQSGLAELLPDGAALLRDRGVKFHVMPTPQLLEAYNACTRPKAALIHVTC